EINAVTTPRPMYVANPSQPVLRAVLPLMKPGETSEFFVPASEAYGELGNESAGVGPCEALLVVVTVTPVTD
ncbi:MAG: FKBP-type peptidyl-prolyl cis-trans isomerase, partial [Muribaculaceae bacterium]|nr:FKBP-type peptidyl-prolyl cis-trans isomerase [Muribaculaceae bacterium]